MDDAKPIYERQQRSAIMNNSCLGYIRLQGGPKNQILTDFQTYFTTDCTPAVCDGKSPLQLQLRLVALYKLYASCLFAEVF